MSILLADLEPLTPDDAMPDPTTLTEAIEQLDDIKDEMSSQGNVILSLHKKLAEVHRRVNEHIAGSNPMDAAEIQKISDYCELWPADASYNMPYLSEWDGLS